VGAKRRLQRQPLPAPLLNIAFDLAEDAYIGAPKAVDGLFPVSHDEELRAGGAGVGGRPGQGVDDGPLVVVGVLKLVHQHGLEFGAPARPDVGVALQEVAGAALQVVEVEAVEGGLALRVARVGVVEQVAQGQGGQGGALFDARVGREGQEVGHGAVGLAQGAEGLSGRVEIASIAPEAFAAALKVEPIQRGEVGRLRVEAGEPGGHGPHLGADPVIGGRDGGQGQQGGGSLAPGRAGKQLLQRFGAGHGQAFVPVPQQGSGGGGQGAQRRAGLAAAAQQIHQGGAHLGGAELLQQHLQPGGQRRGRRRHTLAATAHHLAQGLVHTLGEEQPGLHLVENGKARVEARLDGMSAQQGGAEAMDGADAGALHRGDKAGLAGARAGRARAALEGQTHPFAHFAGRLFGKGDGQDGGEGIGIAASVEQPDVPLDQHAGLATTGPGGDHQAPVVLDGGALFGGEIHMFALDFRF